MWLRCNSFYKNPESKKMISRNELLSNKPLIIAGPCSISDREQILSIGRRAKKAGVHAIRAQLWKPRTKPNTFSGVGEEGIDWIEELKLETGLPVAMEVMSETHVEIIRDVADILWIGARNMQNFSLLEKVSKENKPVILKRGLISSIKEWVGAAEYIGLDKVIMCERGIRTGADSMRFTLDLNSALVIKHDYNLPIIIDPSHTAGRRDMVPHLALAGAAIGADGLVIESHTNPELELVDRDQTITMETLEDTIAKVLGIHQIANDLVANKNRATYANSQLVKLEVSSFQNNVT